MLILAGGGRGLPMDYDELERWTRVEFERGMRSRKGGRVGVKSPTYSRHDRRSTAACVCLLLLSFPEARRAASSICAMPKTRTIAATVAVSFAGSVTVGCGGHLINIAAGVSGRWTSSISSRSDWVTAPTARNRSESLDTEWSTGPTIPMGLSFPHCEYFVLGCPEGNKIF